VNDAAATRIAAITDEFSPDLETALAAMQVLGFGGVELRLIDGRNIVEMSDEEVTRIRAAVEARGMRVVSIASPVLKYTLPGGPPVDERIQQDVFGARYSFEDHPRLAARALEIAALTGAHVVRVFSFWRTVDPRRCFPALVNALRPLADAAATRGLVIGLENEFGCNVGTAEEAADVLASLEHPALGLIWDPANVSVLGPTPFPDGYSQLPRERIVHVHVKDCTVRDFVPTWGPVGRMSIDWQGQISALIRDGYPGWFSLETHWRGDDGDRLAASTMCAGILRDMVTRAASERQPSATLSPLLQDR
jgi:sugar phosphate isomerase/epimerase